MIFVALVFNSNAVTGFSLHSGTIILASSRPRAHSLRLHAKKSKSAKRFKKKLAEAPDSPSGGDDTSSPEIDPKTEVGGAAAVPPVAAAENSDDSKLAGGWSYDPPAPAPPLSAEV